MSGSRSRVVSRNGWNTCTESACSRFEPNGEGTPSGTDDCHGLEVQRKSDADSVRSGSRPGANISSDRTA
jgi:hypothetical protein